MREFKMLSRLSYSLLLTRRFGITLACVAAVCLVASLGCSVLQSVTPLHKPGNVPDIGRLYDRAAQFHDGHRNPVIVIHGVLGARLVDSESGRTVWGEVNRDSIDPEDPAGARIVAHPIGLGTPLDQLKDQVVQAGALDRLRVKVAGVPVEQQAYGEILSTLGIGGYVDETAAANGVDYGDQHFTCFQFSYDWRRDNAENAVLLDAFIKQKSEYVRQERERRFGVIGEPVRFDIVAHSMGGLIARYFLRYGGQALPSDGSLPQLNWAGAEHVDRMILVGTPSGGSVLSVKQIAQGRKLGPFLPTYHAAVLGSMPSLFQLMPRVRHHLVVADGQSVPLYDVNTWEKYGWGMLDPNQDKILKYLIPDAEDAQQRRAIARDHVAKCLDTALRFHQSLDIPARPPSGTTIRLIAGDSKLTDSMLEVDAAGELKVVGQALGDSTVTRRSALMDERNPEDDRWTSRLVTPVDWQQVNFLFAGHIELTGEVAFTDNLLYQLLEAPRKPIGAAPLRQVDVQPPTLR